MTRTQTTHIAEGAAFYAAFLAGTLGALSAWARLCEAHKERYGR